MQAICGSAFLIGLALISYPARGSAHTATKIGTDAVRNATADPMAVQFRNVRVKGAVVCGEYNAKNLAGAYTGFDRFVFEPARGEGFLFNSMARISRKGVIESPDGIIRKLREMGASADATAARQQMKKLTDDASAMLLRCE